MEGQTAIAPTFIVSYMHREVIKPEIHNITLYYNFCLHVSAMFSINIQLHIAVYMRTWYLINFTRQYFETLKLWCFCSSLLDVISHEVQLTHQEQNGRHLSAEFLKCIV